MREDEIAALGFGDPALAHETWHEAQGCEACFNAGYQGRTVAAEVLTLTPEIKQMIVDRRPTEEMRLAAMQNGMGRCGMRPWQGSPGCDVPARGREGHIRQIGPNPGECFGGKTPHPAFSALL